MHLYVHTHSYCMKDTGQCQAQAFAPALKTAWRTHTVEHMYSKYRVFAFGDVAYVDSISVVNVYI